MFFLAPLRSCSRGAAATAPGSREGAADVCKSAAAAMLVATLAAIRDAAAMWGLSGAASEAARAAAAAIEDDADPLPGAGRDDPAATQDLETPHLESPPEGFLFVRTSQPLTPLLPPARPRGSARMMP